jgi:CRISP-associated protein Cas1
MSTLQKAWDKVRANNGAAGADGVSVSQFDLTSGQRLAQLSGDLRAGHYRPGRARAVDVPKKKGGTRRLMIPCVVDRIVQGAAAAVLSPVLEPQFEEGSYAYRPGRSVQMAKDAIARWRDRGFRHVIEADIVGFFDHVRHDRMLDKLDTALRGHRGAGEMVALVTLLLEAHNLDSGAPGLGLPQGSPLSPLLSNLYLDALDEVLDRRGLRMVRFADDFVVLATQRDTAKAALADIVQHLASEGLSLHPAGTRVWDFDRGFEFLGGLFVRSMVMDAANDTEEDPTILMRIQAEMDAAEDADLAIETTAGYDRGDRVLYLLQAGRRLSLRNQSFTVMSLEGHELAGIAPARVDRIEIGPDCSADFGALDHALATETSVALIDGDGATRGILMQPLGGRAALHLAQARAVLDPALSVELARALVNARLRNQRTQLQRLNHESKDPEVTAALAAMMRFLRKSPGADSVASLRGLEGAAAAVYWPTLGRMIEGAPHPFRRKRPASDPANAAINWLSAMLERDMTAALGAAGLHPGFGLLHSPRDGALALVWDMMEPFRAPLTEGLTAFLFNARRLKPQMFTPTAEGIRIHPEARAALVRGYEAAVARPVKATGRNIRLAWRPMMRRQAQDYAKAVMQGDAALFQPYLMEP